MKVNPDLDIQWAVQIQEDGNTPEIMQRLNYQSGSLIVVNDKTLFVIDTSDGTLKGAKALSTDFIFIGIVREYEWTSSDTYAIVRNGSSTTQDIQMEQFNIVSLTSSNSVSLPYTNALICQYGKLGASATVKYFVTIIAEVYYCIDSSMAVIYQADLSGYGTIEDYSMSLGKYSYIVYPLHLILGNFNSHS